MFGLKADQVRVLSPFVGGGFGGKGLWQPSGPGRRRGEAGGPAGAAGAVARGRLSHGRRPHADRAARGIRRQPDGQLDALIHTGVAAMTPHNNCPEQFTFPARQLYAPGHFKLAQKVADMDMVANTFMRAPGESVGTFALESAIDELAARDAAWTRSSCGCRNEPEQGPDDRARRSPRATSSKA